jgi:hypothetical protein
MAKKDDNDVSLKCNACKKALKRVKRYYRENFYYCNKNCYQKKKAADLEAANQASE